MFLRHVKPNPEIFKPKGRHLVLWQSEKWQLLDFKAQLQIL